MDLKAKIGDCMVYLFQAVPMNLSILKTDKGITFAIWCKC